MESSTTYLWRKISPTQMSLLHCKMELETWQSVSSPNNGLHNQDLSHRRTTINPNTTLRLRQSSPNVRPVQITKRQPIRSTRAHAKEIKRMVGRHPRWWRCQRRQMQYGNPKCRPKISASQLRPNMKSANMTFSSCRLKRAMA